MNNKCIRYSILFILLLFPFLASAHSPSTSYLFVTEVKDRIEPNLLKLRWDIALRDLEHVIGIDSNLNGEITWQELKEQQSGITSYAYAHLNIQRNDKLCQLTDKGLQVKNHSDGNYAVLHIEPLCEARQGVVSVSYSLLFEEDADHRGIILDQRGESDSSYILSPANGSIKLDQAHSFFKQLITYIQQGIWHILIGFDHILFVLTLMLPAVLIYQNKQWTAINDFKGASINLLKVITAFTIAHSITLSLATLELVSLPSRWVESAIALSVVLVAINNIKPILTHARWSVAFLFGLVHGFGFASVLNDLNLHSESLLFSLLGFNLGVEIGQAFILLFIFPLAYLLRKTLVYQTYIVKGGSLLISMLASVWLVQRQGCSIQRI